MILKRCIGILTSVFLASRGQAVEPAKPLTVMTYNLRYITSGDKGQRAWTFRRDLAAELLKKNRPDIVGIQEGLRPMLNDLGARVSGYAEIGAGREDGCDKGEFSAILVRADRFTIQESGTFWLSDTPEVPNSCTWGNTVTRVCTWAKLYDRETRQVFHFYNTHLDHASPLARQKGVELILARIAARPAGGPFLLTGDFNAGADDPIHLPIASAPAVDVWKHLHPDAAVSESGTWHDFTGRTDGSRIDFIYASPDIKLIDSAILRDETGGVYPSDHFPVRATIELPGAAK